MPPKKAKAAAAKGKGKGGDKKAKGKKAAAGAGGTAAASPPLPMPEDMAALRAATEQLRAQLETAKGQLTHVVAEREALVNRVAVLEAQGQKDAAVIREMTRMYVAMGCWGGQPRS
jgi:hypothetical protein